MGHPPQRERSPTGPRSFDPVRHPLLIEKHLGIPLPQIKEALNESSRKYREDGNTESAIHLDAFADFLEVIANTPSRNINREKILKIGQRLYAGAKIEAQKNPPAPKSSTPPTDEPDKPTPKTKSKPKPSKPAPPTKRRKKK